MKRIFQIALTVFMVFSLTITAFADFSEFENDVYPRISGSAGDVAEGLERVGIDSDNPESVKNLSTGGVIGYIADIVKGAVSRPLRLMLTVAVFAVICQLTTTLSNKAGLYGEFFLLICFITVSGSVISAFESAIVAMKSCHAFMMSYIPIFAGVAAASGNLAAAASYNAIVLYFCEAAAALAATVLKPILACMLVMAVTQAMNPDLINITATLRNALTVIIGFVMTMFLGIIGLQSLVGRAAEGLAVRAGKYAVSSFVPVIGYSLSESYKAVSLSLSAIRTSIGGFGIVVLCLYMLSPIVTVWVYRTACSLSAWLCRLVGTERLAAMIQGVGDVFGFAQTVLLMFMLMLTVSTGMLIILGGELMP